MDIKNTPSSKNPKKKSGSKWIALGTAAMIAAGVFSTNLSDGQLPATHELKNQKNKTHLVNNNISKQKNDTIHPIGVDKVEYQKLSKELIDAINVYRKENTLAPLLYSSILQGITQGYANYCVENNREEGHVDKEGKGFSYRLEKTGYKGNAKENLYFGWSEPKEIVDMWMTTQGHNETLLFSSGKKISVGIAKNKEDDSYTYVIIVFE